MHLLVVNMKAGMTLHLGCCKPSPPFRTAIMEIRLAWIGNEERPVMWQMKDDIRFSKSVVMGLSYQFHLVGRLEKGRQ